MTTLTGEFQSIYKNQKIDSSLLVPLMRWASGYEANINSVQKVNYYFIKTDKYVMANMLTLNNKLTHFIPYPPPKASDKDDKLDFFYNDLCTYFKWSKIELNKNLSILDIELLKNDISKVFNYDNAQRKLLGLEKRKELKNVGK